MSARNARMGGGRMRCAFTGVPPDLAKKVAACADRVNAVADMKAACFPARSAVVQA